MINFEDFKKLELRVAKILEAEKVEGAEKLLKLKIDLGREQRQLIAGIAKYYRPEELIGKEIVVAANLEPKTIFGLESQGMILAARNEQTKEIALLVPDKKVGPGSLIT